MIDPTQAQIEAAAKAISALEKPRENWENDAPQAWRRDQAKAALAAAAEVGEPSNYRINIAACREANDMLTKENKELRAKLAAASVPLKKRPVMWRVMDDNIWHVFSDEKEARDYADKIGAKDYQGLYVRDGIASEISPLRDQVAGIGRIDYPPTQAQIKAAAAEIEKYCGLNQTAETLARAALTAAAEVKTMASMADEKLVNSPNALTAAALTVQEELRIPAEVRELHEHLKLERTATIERCVQAAKNVRPCGTPKLMRESIIVAIRAMKDKT